jgi:hypothetical protein
MWTVISYPDFSLSPDIPVNSPSEALLVHKMQNTFQDAALFSAFLQHSINFYLNIGSHQW